MSEAWANLYLRVLQQLAAGEVIERLEDGTVVLKIQIPPDLIRDLAPIRNDARSAETGDTDLTAPASQINGAPLRPRSRRQSPASSRRGSTVVPTGRDLAMIEMRDGGKTLREIANEFGVSPSTVQIAERKVHRHRRALAALESDPLNIEASGDAGRLPLRVARALRHTLNWNGAGVERLDELEGSSLRDLQRTPNMGKAGIRAILDLMQEHGLQLRDDGR